MGISIRFEWALEGLALHLMWEKHLYTPRGVGMDSSHRPPRLVLEHWTQNKLSFSSANMKIGTMIVVNIERRMALHAMLLR